MNPLNTKYKNKTSTEIMVTKEMQILNTFTKQK